jgi:hypothetical protein
MNRRIVLNDNEIVSKDFFHGLADLNFERRDGLWRPPDGIATGCVSAAGPIYRDTEHIGIHVGVEYADDLIAQLQICRNDGTRLLVVGAPIRHTIQWVAHQDAPIHFRDGRSLRAFQFMADIADARDSRPLLAGDRFGF